MFISLLSLACCCLLAMSQLYTLIGNRQFNSTHNYWDFQKLPKRHKVIRILLGRQSLVTIVTGCRYFRQIVTKPPAGVEPAIRPQPLANGTGQAMQSDLQNTRPCVLPISATGAQLPLDCLIPSSGNSLAVLLKHGTGHFHCLSNLRIEVALIGGRRKQVDHSAAVCISQLLTP